jgi:hypothetical protein
VVATLSVDLACTACSPAPGQPDRDDGTVTDLRRDAVAALTALATSPAHRDRADAGDALAALAELPEARDALLDLVLDADDTFVTLRTAAALLRRHDRIGLALVGRALARADDNRADWIGTALHDVLGVFAVDRDAAVRDTADLLRDARGSERAGLERLAAALAGLNPVLLPTDR